jgi:hypothetical protein
VTRLDEWLFLTIVRKIRFRKVAPALIPQAGRPKYRPRLVPDQRADRFDHPDVDGDAFGLKKLEIIVSGGVGWGATVGP